ncbi:unnamed protein product, partial [Leptidea sinapis]
EFTPNNACECSKLLEVLNVLTQINRCWKWYTLFLTPNLLVLSNNSKDTKQENESIKSPDETFIDSKKVYRPGDINVCLSGIFCLTYPAISHISDILLWGNTAALAYELPQDPYSPFNHKADPLHRRMDSKAIYYTDEDGKILYKQPYKRRPIVNPAFARRSVNSKEFNIDRGQMHASRKRPDFGDMNENHVEFHRSSRTGLLPKGNIDDFYEEYDGAQASTEPCETLYPECPSTEPTFRVWKYAFVIAIAFGVASECTNICHSENCDYSVRNETRVLSRSKRFLVFPDGSSLQLVFCVQTSAVIPIGDIFLYGNTAALAWNLPTDPNFLRMFKEYEKYPQRRGDTKNVYYLDEDGRVMAKVPFTRPSIVNPAFAKRSVNDKSFKERLKIKIDRMKMHERQKRQSLKKDLNEDSISFHRDSRVELYQKLETLITTLGGEGRQCVLRKLCESAKLTGVQGTFLQEKSNKNSDNTLIDRLENCISNRTFGLNNILLVSYVCNSIGYDEDSTSLENQSRILSRRKRYLTFPDGSSFQLIFCTQNHGYLQIGDIVWFGNTAALAWELPTDPKYFKIFKEHEKDIIQNRNGISKSIYYLDEYGKVLSKIPYHTHMNFTFDDSNIDFHRDGRMDFYKKLESFFRALGVNGKECVFRLLCETSQGSEHQGSFVEEIMRVTFTLPPRKGSGSKLDEYDVAHSTKDDCYKLYPK